MADAARLDGAYAHCESELRRHDRDRWLADLFLPADMRRHAHALHAFSLEAARIREGIHEALPGEIRLQWWIDAIEGEARGDVHAHPVAAALIDTIHRFSLRRQGFVNLLEARRFDLYDDAMPKLNDLEGYAGETTSVLFQQVALILNGGADPGSADLSGHAGVAYAMVGLMRALPIHARRNQVYLPADMLARHGLTPDDIRAGRGGSGLDALLAELRDVARVHHDTALGLIATVPPRVRTAYAGLALVPAYLAALAQAAPFGPPVDIAAWRKPWAMWRLSRRM